MNDDIFDLKQETDKIHDVDLKERMETFYIVKQIITAEYNGKFPVEMYSGFVGVIQQYIFYYARENEEKEA